MIKFLKVFITHNSCIPLLIKNTETDKIQPITGHERPEGEKRYSSILSLTSALDGGGVGDQRHAPAALPPGKTRYPMTRRLGGPQSRSGRVWKISPLAGSDHGTAQPVQN